MKKKTGRMIDRNMPLQGSVQGPVLKRARASIFGDNRNSAASVLRMLTQRAQSELRNAKK